MFLALVFGLGVGGVSWSGAGWVGDNGGGWWVVVVRVDGGGIRLVGLLLLWCLLLMP